MFSGEAADGSAVQAEFTVLRRPGEDNMWWYTAVHQGELMTFRVLDDSGIDPVNGSEYIKSRVLSMQADVQKSSIGLAAEHAYRAVLVEVSLLDDPMAVPEETRRDMDCAIDLWCPLHVALMTANNPAAQQILWFHLTHAVSAMRSITDTSTVVGGIPAVDDQTSPPPVQAPMSATSNTSAKDYAVMRRPVSNLPTLDCQVRRELAGAVVLLSQLDNDTPHPTSAGNSYPDGVENAAAAGGHCCRGNAVSETSAMDNLCRSKEVPTRGGGSLYEDRGEEYCLSNVLLAMRPLLQSIIFEMKRRAQCTTPAVPESATAFVGDYCGSLGALPLHHPPLLVDGDAFFEMCDEGDLVLLSKVIHAFRGNLAPILRGQRLTTDRSMRDSSRIKEPLITEAGVVPAHLSPLNPSPPLRTAVPSTSPSSFSLEGDTSAQSITGALHKCRCGIHSHALPPEPFWWCSPPQQVHRLAFVATWIGCREVVEENSCPDCHRRAVDITKENRMTMTTIHQLKESKVGAPDLDSTLWSGHLIAVTKLLSPVCTTEDYIDFVVRGGYLSFTSTHRFPGLFLSVLVSGVMAAARVQDASMLRLLVCKVRALLADVPGRSSPLRTYVLGCPSTHAERFRELWLDAGRHGVVGTDGSTRQSAGYGAEAEASYPAGGNSRGGRSPMKFRSRVELLYYAVVEQVMAAAEVAWTMRWDEGDQLTVMARGSAAPSPSSSQPSSAAKAEALAALGSWLLLWTGFLSDLCGAPSLQGRHDHGSSSSQVVQQGHLQHTPNSAAEASLTVDATTPPTAHHPPAAATDDVFGEEANDTSETVQRLRGAFCGRLKTGQDPLPALFSVLFPNGGSDDDVDTGALASGTSAHGGNKNPVPSIDERFASAQHAFAAMASRESNEVKLKFYSLFKQATCGDVNTSRPGVFDYAGRAKWEAWAKLKGLSSLDAKHMYVNEYDMMVEALRKSQK